MINYEEILDKYQSYTSSEENTLPELMERIEGEQLTLVETPPNQQLGDDQKSILVELFLMDYKKLKIFTSNTSDWVGDAVQIRYCPMLSAVVDFLSGKLNLSGIVIPEFKGYNYANLNEECKSLIDLTYVEFVHIEHYFDNLFHAVNRGF